MKIDKVLTNIKFTLETAFPGLVHSYIEEDTGKTCFVILDRKIFFEKESLVWQIDALFSDYADYFMIGWDYSGKYKKYIKSVFNVYPQPRWNVRQHRSTTGEFNNFDMFNLTYAESLNENPQWYKKDLNISNSSQYSIVA
jgi:hypothetical protein